MQKTILVALAVALGQVLPVHAATDAPSGPPDDLDALSLADKAPESATQATRPWRLFLEGAVGQGKLRANDDPVALHAVLSAAQGIKAA